MDNNALSYSQARAQVRSLGLDLVLPVDAFIACVLAVSLGEIRAEDYLPRDDRGPGFRGSE